jgi:hypothetical protein
MWEPSLSVAFWADKTTRQAWNTGTLQLMVLDPTVDCLPIEFQHACFQRDLWLLSSVSSWSVKVPWVALETYGVEPSFELIWWRYLMLLGLAVCHTWASQVRVHAHLGESLASPSPTRLTETIYTDQLCLTPGLELFRMKLLLREWHTIPKGAHCSQKILGETSGLVLLTLIRLKEPEGLIGDTSH